MGWESQVAKDYNVSLILADSHTRIYLRRSVDPVVQWSCPYIRSCRAPEFHVFTPDIWLSKGRFPTFSRLQRCDYTMNRSTDGWLERASPPTLSQSCILSFNTQSGGCKCNRVIYRSNMLKEELAEALSPRKSSSNSVGNCGNSSNCIVPFEQHTVPSTRPSVQRTWHRSNIALQYVHRHVRGPSS